MKYTTWVSAFYKPKPEFDTAYHSHTGESDSSWKCVSLSDTSVRHCHTFSASSLFNSALHDIAVPNPVRIFYSEKCRRLRWKMAKCVHPRINNGERENLYNVKTKINFARILICEEKKYRKQTKMTSECQLIRLMFEGHCFVHGIQYEEVYLRLFR